MAMIFPARLKNASMRQYSGCTLVTWLQSSTQNGAAMSVGRVSTFLDIYIQSRIWKTEQSTEAEAQELIDHFVMKCRMVKFAQGSVLQPAVLR